MVKRVPIADCRMGSSNYEIPCRLKSTGRERVEDKLSWLWMHSKPPLGAHAEKELGRRRGVSIFLALLEFSVEFTVDL